MWGKNLKFALLNLQHTCNKRKYSIKTNHDIWPSIQYGYRLEKPSHVALKCLAKDVDYLMTLEDDFVAEEIKILEKYNLKTSPSAEQGLLSYLLLKNELLEINETSRFYFISEGAN